MKSPFQEGSFSFPIKYGYINVGKIVEGPKKYLNKNTFCLYPHQSLFKIDINNVNILKGNGDIRKYLLTANMETAINIFWDTQAKLNNKILIIGMGSVGILTAYYYKLLKFKNVFITDINIKKKKFANILGLKFINFKKIKDLDVIINTTSNYDVLNQSLKKLNLEGKFIEASWYGNRKGHINLGGNFHSKRLKIIGSQVSNIPKYLSKKYDYKKRLNLAINALSNNQLLKLINTESDFQDLEKDYISILNNPESIMHAIKY
jgi:threonine dehydrogenase-like Zn-dependent dehydrogenase